MRETSKQALIQEIAQNHHEGNVSVAAREVEMMYQQAIGDMYTLLKENRVVEVLQSVVNVSRGIVVGGSSKSCSEPSSSSSSGCSEASLPRGLRTLKNKLNFLMAVYINYGDLEKSFSRRQLKKDILSQTWRKSGRVSNESSSVHDV